MFDGLDLSKNPTPYNFGIPERDFIPVIDAVVAAMRNPSLGLPPLDQRDSKQEILDWIGKVQAPKIAKIVDGVIAQEYPGKPSKFVREWLLCEAAVEWTRLYIAYDDGVARKLAPGSGVGFRANKIENTLGQAEPSSVCGGFSAVSRALSRALGLTSFDLTVCSRPGFDAPAPPFSSSVTPHAVLLIHFSNGQIGVADVPRSNVRHIDSVSQRGTGGLDRWLAEERTALPFKSNSHMVMPRTASQWELFLTRNVSDIPYKSGVFSGSRDYQRDLWVGNLRYPEWAQLSPKGALEREYRAAEGGR